MPTESFNFTWKQTRALKMARRIQRNGRITDKREEYNTATEFILRYSVDCFFFFLLHPFKPHEKIILYLQSGLCRTSRIKQATCVSWPGMYLPEIITRFRVSMADTIEIFIKSHVMLATCKKSGAFFAPEDCAAKKALDDKATVIKYMYSIAKLTQCFVSPLFTRPGLLTHSATENKLHNNDV